MRPSHDEVKYNDKHINIDNNNYIDDTINNKHNRARVR